MSQLVAKASDYLGMSKNQETQISLKRLNERVAELENQLKDQRIEHQAEVSQLQEAKAALQAEQNHHIKNELVMEERIKRAQEEA